MTSIEGLLKGYLDTFHWSDVTNGEVGSMVREAIKRGEQVIAEEAKVYEAYFE